MDSHQAGPGLGGRKQGSLQIEDAYSAIAAPRIRHEDKAIRMVHTNPCLAVVLRYISASLLWLEDIPWYQPLPFLMARCKRSSIGDMEQQFDVSEGILPGWVASKRKYLLHCLWFSSYLTTA